MEDTIFQLVSKHCISEDFIMYDVIISKSLTERGGFSFDKIIEYAILDKNLNINHN